MADSHQSVAEAKVQYFCHQCRENVDPKLPAFVCPRCRSGFIEEIESNSDSEQDVSSTESADVTLGGLPLSSSDRGVTGSVWEQYYRRHHNHTHVPLGATAARMQSDIDVSFSGLEDIISQLVSQLAGAGPPPSSQSQIDALPKRVIALESEIKTNNCQCCVCMDLFKVSDTITSLPCLHCFHTGCIIPWLRLHGTCPICRHCPSNMDRKTSNVPSPSSHTTSLSQNSFVRSVYTSPTTSTDPQQRTPQPNSLSTLRSLLEEDIETVEVDDHVATNTEMLGSQANRTLIYARQRGTPSAESSYSNHIMDTIHIPIDDDGDLNMCVAQHETNIGETPMIVEDEEEYEEGAS